MSTVPKAEGREGSYPRLNDTPVTYDGGVNIPATSHSSSWRLRRDYWRSGLEAQMAPLPLATTSHLANKDADR